MAGAAGMGALGRGRVLRLEVAASSPGAGHSWRTSTGMQEPEFVLLGSSFPRGARGVKLTAL